jgi:hypothetical protein
MALSRDQLLKLMKTVTSADSSPASSYTWEGETFSYSDLNDTLRNELRELAGDYYSYIENANLIHKLVSETIDDILPERVKIAYEQFAEIKFCAQGDKVKFIRKMSRKTRAKQFITRAALAGVYETFKLAPATESFEVPTSAMGGAAQIGFEEFLDGRVDWVEVVNIVLDGIDELLYEEMQAAMQAAINQLPPANRVVANTFNEVEFDRLINIAEAYGTVTIYCTKEFATKLMPKDGWRYTEAMKDELFKTGRLGMYKGSIPIVILPQGFTDGTNTRKTVDASYCWIVPNTADNKPIKVVFEGNTIVDEYVNRDRSRELQAYCKCGVVAMLANNMCCYRDTSLASMTTWSFGDTVNYNVNVNGIADNQNTSTTYVYEKVDEPTGSPVENGYYEKIGSSFVESTDATVDAAKTYYIRVE